MITVRDDKIHVTVTWQTTARLLDTMMYFIFIVYTLHIRDVVHWSSLTNLNVSKANCSFF